MPEGNTGEQRGSWGFTSRWWAGIATVFGLLTPLTLFLAFVLSIGQVVTDGPRPGEWGPNVFGIVAIVVPLGLGALIASWREIRLPAEPRLEGWRAWRRWMRIGLGFALPFLIARMFLASQMRP